MLFYLKKVQLYKKKKKKKRESFSLTDDVSQSEHQAKVVLSSNWLDTIYRYCHICYAISVAERGRQKEL